jgi:hypothetical protein
MPRFKENASQAVTATVKDALRLDCSAIGYTIYPGSDAAYDQMRDIAEMAQEVKSYGLAVVIWSYPRGGNLWREGESAIDISAYATQIAAQLGAHIIKVKPPTAHLEFAAAKKVYEDRDIDISTPAAHPPCRAVGVQRAAHRRLLGRRSQGPRRRLRRSPRGARWRWQRLDHRPQHLPAVEEGRDRHAVEDRQDLSKEGLILGCHCERSEAISKS